MKESPWTRKICKQIEAAGGMTFPIVGGPMQPAGWPDRIVIVKGWCGLIEFKGEETQVSRLQWLIIENIHKRGPYAYIARYPGHLFNPDDLHIGSFTTGQELVKLLQDNCPG